MLTVRARKLMRIAPTRSGWRITRSRRAVLGMASEQPASETVQARLADQMLAERRVAALVALPACKVRPTGLRPKRTAPGSGAAGAPDQFIKDLVPGCPFDFRDLTSS